MAIIVIDLYTVLFSAPLAALTGNHCRFSPTCSCYARGAFVKFGFFKGLYLTLHRLLRCGPWGRHGVDELPLKTGRLKQ